MKAKNEKNTEKYGAPALSKGLDILELLAQQSAGMKKSEIAKTLNRSLSEIFRMLVVLTDRGYVSVDKGNERYSLTLKMFEIAHRYPPVKRLTSVATDIMAELANALNQSIHLAILYGSDILVIAQNDSPGNNVTSVRLGARVPVVQAASGAVLTSQLNEARRKEICAGIENTTAAQCKIFEKNVQQAVAEGVCVSASVVIAGVQNISVPIFDYSGSVIAALTIPYIQRLIATDDPDLPQAKTALTNAGQRISHLLGAGVNDLAVVND